MPEDYNPFGLIDQMENLLRFTNKAYNSLPDTTIKVDFIKIDTFFSISKLFIKQKLGEINLSYNTRFN
jgi:hypothetical protein